MKEEKYLTSSEAKKELKIKDCDLSHLRLAGKLKFVKKGNAFKYLVSSIKILKNNM